MISCEYIGRLGNNLFQIGAAVSLAYEYNDECVIPSWAYQNVFKLEKIRFGDNRHLTQYNEPEFSYHKIPYQENIRLWGYFQSEKYMNKLAIEENLTFKNEKVSYITEKYKDLLLLETVSIHVRRTDYLTITHQHPTQSLEYYTRGLEIIENKNLIDKIVIFSDDIEYCQQNFKDEKYVFVHESDYYDMLLMSMCNHNIIANSSFSWWGAFLNKNENKTVIAPENWFGPHYAHYNKKDLYAEGWIVI